MYVRRDRQKWHIVNRGTHTVCGMTLDKLPEQTEVRPETSEICTFCLEFKKRPAQYGYDPPGLRNWRTR